MVLHRGEEMWITLGSTMKGDNVEQNVKDKYILQDNLLYKFSQYNLGCLTWLAFLFLGEPGVETLIFHVS